MKNLLLALSLSLAGVLVPAAGSAQTTAPRLEAASLPPLVKVRQRAAAGGNNPILRTLAAVAGSAAGFALAQAQSNAEPDDIAVPMAAAVAGGAIGTMIFSNFVPMMASSSGNQPSNAPLTVEIEAPAGSSLGYTAGKAREVASIIGDLPRVSVTQTTISPGDSGAFTNAVLSANLLPQAGSGQSDRELIELARRAIQPVAGIRTTVVPTRSRPRSANPFQVIAGSALSALPGAALAMYLVGVTDDEEQDKMMPLIAFSVPHGLLTSAFGQSR
jgi:multidrug efflux pump subunit AcrB